MTRLRQTTTNFTAGEISPDLLGRGDITAYSNGAARLRNVSIQPTGGVTRRAGMRYVSTLVGAARLIPFDFAQQSGGMIALSHGRLDIFLNGVFLGFITAPYAVTQLSQITWAQSADTLLLLHPDIPPKKFVRVNATTYTLSDWTYTVENGVIQQPYFKYVDSTVTLTPSATSGNITVTASAGVFWAALTGTRYRINGREILVTGVNSPSNLNATVIQTLTTTAATTDWQEQAFSAVRGYPSVACFHQDRLVLSGARDVPNRMWMSRTGDMWNFRIGTGLDTDAIEFSIVSDHANAVRGLYSSRYLQVFTSGAEYIVSGDPMTPLNVQIRRQTRIGSMTSRYLPPVVVEGVAMFMARNGQELREFAYTDSVQAYESSDLALLAKHMLVAPIDQIYDAKRRIIYVARSDGQIAALSFNRNENIKAWALYETTGTVTSLCISGDETYFVVLRGSNYYLERLDDTFNSDAGIKLTAGTAQTVWTGLTHLNGMNVTIVADGVVRTNQTVAGGQVTISPAALSLEIGLPFRHIIEPLPPSLSGTTGDGKAIRLVEATYRLRNTCALRLDVGRGLRNVNLMAGQPTILPTTAPLTAGDISVSAFGWYNDMTKSLWVIDQDHPVPFTLLGVKTELKRND